MKGLRQRLVQAIFVVSTVVSLIYNGFVTSSSSSTITVGDAFLSTASVRTQNKQRRIFLGISCSQEMQAVILKTYLNSALPTHAFSGACAFEDEGNHNHNNTNCRVLYKFWTDSTPILSWWLFVRKVMGETNDNPLILWVTGRTILYPPYLNDFQDTIPSTTELVFGETPIADCTRRLRKPDRMTCQKLSGQAVLISYRALSEASSCWISRMSWQTSLPLATNRNDALAQCLTDNTTTKVALPHQFQRPDPGTFDIFWNKLVHWNDLPVPIASITAKFGRDAKFAHEVERTKAALLSFGYSPKLIHGYSSFPEVILQDVRWKPHLEFLHNTSLRPKGAGYWFWKAPLLLHHLDLAEEGDFVVYADADLRDHGSWLTDLVQEMITFNTSLALYQVEYLERKYTKRDVYEYYCHKDPSTDQSLQYAGGWLVVRKTPGIMAFVKQWQEGVSNYTLLDDSPSQLPNIPEFVYHLHDQSILSTMLKCQYTQIYEQRMDFDGGNKTLKDWLVHMFQI
jgi:hypothetical protein